jgi:hypothetical protein
MGRTFGNRYTISNVGTVTAGSFTATQTNEGFDGVSVYIPITAVMGWSSSADDLKAQLQWSPDGGTTWFTIGADALGGSAFAAVDNAHSSLLLTTGPFVSLNNGVAFQENGGTTNGFFNYGIVLPRLWRVLFSLRSGNSTATYTIGTVQVEYF